MEPLTVDQLPADVLQVYADNPALRTAACGVAVAVLLAWRGRSLLTVAVAACCAVALAQGFLLLIP